MSASPDRLEKVPAALHRAIAMHDRVMSGSDIDLTETTRSCGIQCFEVVFKQSQKVLRHPTDQPI